MAVPASVTVPAAVSYIRRDPACSVLLVGLQDVLNAELKRLGAENEPRLLVVHATEVIGISLEEVREVLIPIRLTLERFAFRHAR